MLKLTTRRLSSFKLCRLQYYFKEIKCLERKNKPDYFYVGSLVHDGLEFLYKNNFHLSNDLKKTKEFVKKYMSELASDTLKKIAQDGGNIDFLKFELNKAIVLLLGYVDFYFPEKNWVKVKAEFEVKYTYSSPSFNVDLRLDLIWNKDNKLWVIDHKTVSRMEEYETKILIDDQLSLYMLSLATHVQMNKLPYEMAGAIFNIIQKPKIRQSQKETSKEFINRLYQDVHDRPEFYYERKTRVFGEIMFYDFEEELKRVMIDMKNFNENPENLVYRNPGGHCKYCFYKEICLYGDSMKELYVSTK